MEYARLGPVVDRYRGFLALEGDLATARELEMEDELKELSPRVDAEEQALQRLLVPEGPARREQHLPRGARRHRRRRGRAVRRRPVPDVCALCRIEALGGRGA